MSAPNRPLYDVTWTELRDHLLSEYRRERKLGEPWPFYYDEGDVAPRLQQFEEACPQSCDRVAAVVGLPRNFTRWTWHRQLVPLLDRVEAVLLLSPQAQDVFWAGLRPFQRWRRPLRFSTAVGVHPSVPFRAAIEAHDPRLVGLYKAAATRDGVGLTYTSSRRPYLESALRTLEMLDRCDAAARKRAEVAS